jgi:hypothetical protein
MTDAHLAITGNADESMIFWIISGHSCVHAPIRADIGGDTFQGHHAQAPASSAILAWSAVTTSMITHP